MADRRSWALPAIVGLALVARGALFLLAAPHPERFFTLDAVGYVALARDLRAGYLDPGAALFATGLMRTPAYPLFVWAILGLAAGSLVAVILVQIALGLGTLWLTHRLGRRLFGLPTANIAAFILAVDPVSCLYVNVLQPEALFTFLLTAAAVWWLAALRAGTLPSAAITGALVGLATLARPIGLFLPVPLLLLLWTRRRDARWRLATALLLPFALLVGGWMVRNAALTGVPLLSTIEGTNLLYYRAAGALAEERGITIDDARARLRERLQGRTSQGANPAQVSRAESALAFEVLREHPRGAATSTAHGALRLIAGTGLTAFSNLCGDPDPEGLEGIAKLGGLALLGVALAALYLGAARGVLILAREGAHQELAFVLAFILYFVLISAGPEANTRFRFPTMPFWTLLAGYGYTASRRRTIGGLVPA